MVCCRHKLVMILMVMSTIMDDTQNRDATDKVKKFRRVDQRVVGKLDCYQSHTKKMHDIAADDELNSFDYQRICHNRNQMLIKMLIKMTMMVLLPTQLLELEEEDRLHLGTGRFDGSAFYITFCVHLLYAVQVISTHRHYQITVNWDGVSGIFIKDRLHLGTGRFDGSAFYINFCVHLLSAAQR